MLRGFDRWPDVLEHVRSGGAIYYVPNEDFGPARMIARIRSPEQEVPRIWLRQPEYMAHTFPTMIADITFMDKLYRWEPVRATLRPRPEVTTDVTSPPETRRDTPTRRPIR